MNISEFFLALNYLKDKAEVEKYRIKKAQQRKH